MNWIRKTFIFSALTIVFLFAFSAKQVAIDKIQLEKQESSISIEKIHSSAVIEPQASHSISFLQKTQDFSFSKYLENYLVFIPDFRIGTFFIPFANQDINRCEKVSLLLFPYHIFW